MSTNNQPKSINEKELEIQKFWEENAIFEKSLLHPAGQAPKGSYSFFDGPPFATGMPHIGHILAGTIKDAIPRYQTMKGNYVRRVWGWDCHGLPVENLIEKKLDLSSKKAIEDYGIDKFNKEAQDSVLMYDTEWKRIVPRLGRWVDMEHPYKTMDSTYTESVWWSWKELYEKGLAYEGSKMMHICPRCETPLAQSEVGLEYHDVTDLSVTTKFELVDEPGTYVLAWTTTPWTLPGNTALALHKDIVYVKVAVEGEEGRSFFIIAKSRLAEYFKDESTYTVVEEFSGEKLIGRSYVPPFNYFKDAPLEYKENIWKIWHAHFITDDAGTGIAHEAPAFGADDMELAKAHNIPVIKHVKMDGTFIDAVADFQGMKVKKKDDTQSCDIEIIKWLAHNGKLFEKHKIVHSYPLCWRCATPLLNYATSSWFVDVPKIKEKLIAENQKIGWTPAHIRDGRFGKWLEGAREWAVSRTRYWGAPLPVWKGPNGEVKVLGSLKELAELRADTPRNTYYVMRHGESESNVFGRIETNGDPHNHLTEKGKEQVREAIKKMHFTPDVIVTSPFARTVESSHLLHEAFPDAVVVKDDRIREFNMGAFDGKMMKEYLDFYGHHYLKFDTRPEGGETHREIMHRMMAVISEYEQQYEGKHILFVTHGGPARMLLAGSQLLTEEEVLKDGKEDHLGLYLENAECKKVELYLVPRDETGAVNLHRPYIDRVKLSIDGQEYTRIVDVFDCWYESGSMPFAQLHYPFENKETFDKNYPADFIAEGMDQTRGWFYSLINLGVGLFGKAPYKHVIVNGVVLAEGGEKMSKSKKNYTDPRELIEKFGIDAIRYFLLSSPVIKGESVEFADKSVDEVYKKVIQRLENVLSLYEMNVPQDVVRSASSSDVLNAWIISRVHEVVSEATKGYDTYMLDEAVRPIDQFVDDLSVWYVRRKRSALKGDEGEEVKRETYGVLSYVLHTFSLVAAPVMPFLAERVYRTVCGERESVHLEAWPHGGQVDEQGSALMKKTRELVSLGLMARTKENISVKQPLLSVSFRESLPKEYEALVEDELNVKSVLCNKDQTEEVILDTTITEELKKEGDIRKLIRAVQDARKEASLVASDVITLTISEDIGDLSSLLAVCKVGRVVVDPAVSSVSVELSSKTVLIAVAKE